MYALINTHSGSVPDDARNALNERLVSYGYKPDIRAIEPDGLQIELSKLAENPPKELIVWGGDGTLACVLQHEAMKKTAVLPLPGGTMNLLHQLVHGEYTSWSDCLDRALNLKEIKHIPCGMVGSQRFYVGLTLGKLSQLSVPREAIREGHIAEAAEDFLASDALDIEPNLVVSYKNPKGVEKRLGATAIGALLTSSRRQANTSFDIGLLKPSSHWDLAKAALASMINDWREAPDVAFIKTRTFSVYSKRKEAIAATFDGEPAELEGNIEVKFIEDDALIWTTQ